MITKALELKYAKAKSLPERPVSGLRGGNGDPSRLEKVLLPRLRLAGMGQKTPKAKTIWWAWDVMMSKSESTHLPVFTFGNTARCTYCGDPAVERDHVIPVSYQSVHEKNRTSGNGPLTWACRDCNQALSNRYFDTFLARCEWAKWRLECRVKPIEWHNREIRELDHSLRDFVRTEAKKRLWMRNRADFFESRDFILNIENLAWEMQCRRPDTIGTTFLFSYFSSTLRLIAELYKPRRD